VAAVGASKNNQPVSFHSSGREFHKVSRWLLSGEIETTLPKLEARIAHYYSNSQ
jgi:hypothetical protein